MCGAEVQIVKGDEEAKIETECRVMINEREREKVVEMAQEKGKTGK